jgi:N6-L-threonylcarbamoyladenine synthase
MKILSIETSCDETALALLEVRGEGFDIEYKVIDSIIHSQADIHSTYGGVFPTLAKREHSKNLLPLLEKIIKDNQINIKSRIDDNAWEAKWKNVREKYISTNPDLINSLENSQILKDVHDIDLIAVTEGPGLEPALWVGINFANILNEIWNVPIIPVNHMEGHIVGSLIDTNKDGDKNTSWKKLHAIPLPCIAMLISGGHTELVLVNKENNKLNYKIIGQTKDDAVGEAFDKVARLLDLPYPGGPQISKLANEARQNSLINAELKLPRPMIKSDDLNFSFSGLKTAVLYTLKKKVENGGIDDIYKQCLAREFEDSVTEVLDSKLHKAIDEYGGKSIIVGGGVSANNNIRNTLEKTAKTYEIPIFLPDRHISGDNALMIAIAGAINHDPKTEAEYTLKAQGTKSL